MQTRDLEPPPERNLARSSPLDSPLSSTYIRVIVVEAVIIVLLVILGRTFS
jgi:hypothetical protein